MPTTEPSLGVPPSQSAVRWEASWAACATAAVLWCVTCTKSLGGACVAPRRTRLLPRLVLAASVTMQQRLQLLPLLLRLLQRCPHHNSKSVGWFVASASAS